MLAVTKVYDPRVLRIGAVFAILLGFIPKFGGFLQDTPLPVLGGISIVLFGMIASIGMRVLTESRVDFTQSRNLIVAALILVFGLGVSGLDSPIQIGDVAVSGLALAAVIGVVANLVLPNADRRAGVRRSSGESCIGKRQHKPGGRRFGGAFSFA